MCLNFQRATEAPSAVVGVRTVVTDEDAIVTAIPINRAAEFPDILRRLQPARRLRVELAQLLQREIFLLRQHLHAHVRRRIQDAVFGFVFLARIQRRAVVAKTDTALGTLRGTIHEDELARLFILTDHIRFAAGAFHFRERPQLFRPDLQPRLHLGPQQTMVAAQVLFKPGFQRGKQFFTLFGGQFLFAAGIVFHKRIGFLKSFITHRSIIGNPVKIACASWLVHHQYQMALVRPRLNDYHGLGFTQEEAGFAIPFLDDDIPLYVDPFLLWKSPSQQDHSLHIGLVSSFNHLGHLVKNGKEKQAVETLIRLSECQEAGLGSARDKRGKRIGEGTAKDILTLFSSIPQVKQGGFEHIEEIQLFVDQIGKDRVSDLTCSLTKSFLIDFTIDECRKHSIPTKEVTLEEIFDSRENAFKSEKLPLPVNPVTNAPLLLVPKRWLRFSPWINYDDYFAAACVKDGTTPKERLAVLQFNRHNYDMVQAFIRQKERLQTDCKNDPLFRPIAVSSARRKLEEIKTLPSGKTNNADKRYEELVCQLLASLFYPQLDFAAEQSRTDSGALIRDLIFYNNRSFDFLKDIFDTYDSRQVVFELKNVREVERDHVNQLNRYLNDEFGKFGVLVTRNPLPRHIHKNTIDLWSSQRRCIIALTDADLEMMVTVFESKQRLPIEVLKRAYLDFTRSFPS